VQAERCALCAPRQQDKDNRRSNGVSVLFDGNKSPATIHREYVEVLLPAWEGQAERKNGNESENSGMLPLRVRRR